MNTNFRFYKNELPKVDSFVMVKILKVEPLGATCKLLEYNGLTGFMPSSQFSRRRIRSIRQVAKAGTEEILQVLDVNPQTGAIDLSKKSILFCPPSYMIAQKFDCVPD